MRSNIIYAFLTSHDKHSVSLVYQNIDHLIGEVNAQEMLTITSKEPFPEKTEVRVEVEFPISPRYLVPFDQR